MTDRTAQVTVNANARGPKGNTGGVGPVGPVGPIGPTGPQGLIGNTGPQGVIGNTGPVGATGPIGPQGDPGQDIPADLSTAPLRAPWVNKITGRLHPRHFGTPMDGVTDAAAGLQAFFDVMTTERWGAGHNLDGYFKTSQPLVIDGGVFGADITFALDFGLNYIEATAPMDRLLTIQDCHNSMFSGRSRLRGQGWASAGIANHTCSVGLLASKVSQSQFGSFYMEGFNFAGLELDQGPTGGGYNNDSCHWLKIAGQRVGSGSSSANRAYTANWSGRVDSGGNNSAAQYSTITVDALPSAYACSNSIVANVPDRQMQVEIAGQLCTVVYIDTATNTLRVYPWINATAGNSGTLKYHSGAGIVLLGGDSSLQRFDQVDFNQSGCVAQFSALFGSSVGILHGEVNGTFAKFGKNNNNNFGTVTIDLAYAEGNTFRYVPIAQTNYGIDVPADLGADTEAKDYDCSISSNAGVVNTTSPGFIGFSQTALKGGQHFKVKSLPIPASSAGTGGETLDFGTPNLQRCPSFYNTGARNFTLVAPSATKKSKWGYDMGRIVVAGSGSNGAANGTITFIPPAGHTINGGAASANYLYPTAALNGPTEFVFVMSSSTAWLIYTKEVQQAVSTVTGRGSANGFGSREELTLARELQIVNKVLQTTFSLDLDTALAAASDSRVASQKAIKAYVDALIAAVSAGADVEHPGYIVNRYYWLLKEAALGAGATFTANTIKLLPFTLSKPITVSALAAHVTTLSAGGNFQAAVYANGAGQATGLPLCYTGNISTGAVGAIGGATNASVLLNPGTYWQAINQDNGVAVYKTLPAASPHAGYYIGSATLANVSSGAGTSSLVHSIAQTFGAWPDLTASAPVEQSSNTSAVLMAKAA